MAKTYYGYAERNVDSELNWFEIGQGISNILKEEQRLRQEKKDAIDKSTREFMNYLGEAPQGINQDANNFTNNFTSDMMKQKMIDLELLKSGRMDVNKFTLRQQNYMDGTKQLFNLQKLYQDNAQKIMEAIDQKKTIPALALYNMKTIEGYANFNSSRATIDSEGDGRIGLALYENKLIDGKMVRVLSKNMTPVNVIAGQILNQPAYYDAEAATNKSVEAFGDRVGTLYNAATVAKAGTITEFTGVGAMEKYGKQFGSVIKEFNDYLSAQADSMLSDEYNIISVLTENIGKYDSDSFTYDRNEAQANKSKILLKIDPSTTQPIMDDKAPHYEEQKKEAKEWIISNMRSKFDRKTELKTTSQLSTNYAPEYILNRGDKTKDDVAVSTMIGTLYAGRDSADIQKAANAFRDINPNIQSIVRSDEGVIVTLIGPDKKIQTRELSFYGPNGGLMSQEDFIRSAAPLLAGNANVETAIKRGGVLKGRGLTELGGTKVEAIVQRPQPEEEVDYTPQVTDYVTKNTSSSVIPNDATQTAANLTQKYGRLNFKFKADEDTGLGTKDNVIIVAPDGTESAPIPVDNLDNIGVINQYIIDNSKGQNYSGVFKGASGTSSSTKNPNGVGSKY